MLSHAARLGLVGVFLALFSASFPAGAEPQHPLDPLEANEITHVTDIIRAYKGAPANPLFPVVALAEPPKTEVLAYRASKPFRREAQVVVYDRKQNRTYEAIVDLRQGKVSSWRALLAGTQPLLLISEYELVPRIVKADPRFVEAMKKRGITDLARVAVDTWATGTYTSKNTQGARLVRAITYLKDDGINFYARPIEGVTAIVDVNAERIVDFIDTGVVPVSTARAELDEKSLGTRPLKSIEITEPEGVNFELRGHEVSWQNWSFHWAMHPREGLVIQDVRYRDGKALRPVMYRGSISEMVVPYGDPEQHWIWRNAFDEGEYGIGRLASPLEPAQDATKNAVFFDVPFADDVGKAYVLPRAVGLYERDGGILWKHYDINSNINQTRRARELVIFFVAVIGNYDYAINWIFRQDGSIRVECDLTGIMLAKGVSAKSATDTHGAAAHDIAHAHLVAPLVAAPHHQHFFNFRLDLDPDGTRSQVFEMNTRPAKPSVDNAGNVIEMSETPLSHETIAQRDLDLSLARKWRVGAAGKRSALGYQPSFLLAPGGNSIPYLAAETPTRKRAPFLNHHLFVTRYKEGERHSAGWYPNQHPGGTGLDSFIRDDEPLDGQDVVLWYTMGLTHVPRPEEWPVMPVHTLSFELLPVGFFNQNPALDVPRVR